MMNTGILVALSADSAVIMLSDGRQVTFHRMSTSMSMNHTNTKGVQAWQ
jgi:hypothetical protein